MRHMLIALAIALAPVLLAQASVNLAGDVPEERIHYYMFDVDHGSTPTTLDITVDLTATGSAGLDVTIRDLNEWAALGPVFEATDFVFPSGQVIVTLSLPSRAGVHQVLVAIEIDSADGNTPYTGTASVSAGNIAQADFDNAPMQQGGILSIFDRLIFLNAQGGTAGIVFMDIVLDFGPTTHSANLRVRVGAQGNGVQLRLLDMSTTPPTVIDTVTGGTPVLIDDDAYALGPHTGVVTYRVELTKMTAGGLLVSEVVVGSDITLNSMTVLTFDVAKKKKESDDCAVSATGAGWPVLALAMSAALAVLRRRQAA